MKEFRPSAIPLVTVDPYFSIWSFTDKLYDDSARHWTGRRCAMSAFFKIDGKWYRVMGHVQPDNYRYFSEPESICQKKCTVDATRTHYEFENSIVKVSLDFRTPLLTNDLMLMTSPVSYITYEADFVDGKAHELEFYFDISSSVCSDDRSAEISFGKTDFSVYCGRESEEILMHSGDDRLIDWGRLHLVVPGAEPGTFTEEQKRLFFKKGIMPSDAMANKVPGLDNPVLYAIRNYGAAKHVRDFVCVAYDDKYSIEYFGKKLEPYWKSQGLTFKDAVSRAVTQYESVNKLCDDFDTDLRQKCEKFGSDYADLVTLAYRQVIAAHKLVKDKDKLLFCSKECFSNGCIATVDVTYPSFPMFLYFNPELAKGMLNPVFEYATGDHGWEYEFAPHDVGTYPKANGQAYGFDKDDPDYRLSWQMPIEECGNMLICTATVCKADGNAAYAADKTEILSQWADYLVKCGYDPENQLCTDDFAGHLAHNCNLSVKGILGIACFGYILNMLGENGEKYIQKAKELGKIWQQEAYDGNCYRLAFDKPGTWSLKYNLVWDRYFGFDIFDESVARTEVSFYKTKLGSYGVPLDNRKGYTKSDWQMWTTCLTDDDEYRDMITERMHSFVCETPFRVPFPDWYETEHPTQCEFQGRTVQGGLFINLLFDK